MRISRMLGSGALLLGLAAFAALANAGVSAASKKGKSFGCSLSGACVAGVSSGSANGFAGTSTKSNGVAGSATGSSAIGVLGYNTGAAGYGVAGRTLGGGFSYGVYADGGPNGADSLKLENASSGLTDTIEAKNFGFGTTTLVLDSWGNLFITGLLYTSVNCTNGCAKTNDRFSAYGLSESRPAIEDDGEARLNGGATHVALSAAVARELGASADYVVLVTPEGDTLPLFVEHRTPNGFDVRESSGGNASIPFSYRIVAHPSHVNATKLPFIENLDVRRSAQGA